MTTRALVLEDVPSCAALLVARHAAHRLASPLLDPLDQVAAERAVTALLSVDGARGAVRLEAGVIVGYLVGTTRTSGSWGGNVWVEPAGCAGSGLAELWAWLATDWVAAGLTAHYVLVPPSLVPTFFELGFGMQQVHAARAVAAEPLDPRVRRAARPDIPRLAELDVLLDTHLAASPVFSSITPTSVQEGIADWESSIDDPDFTTFVAEVDGEVVGSAVCCDVSQSSSNTGLIAPHGAGLLGFAAVLPPYRGLGLSRGLHAAVLQWCVETGRTVICSDWRGTNPQASRAWTARGYAQTFVRLHRLVGH